MTTFVRAGVPFLLLTAPAQTWTNVSNAVHPTARYASAMMFDQARQQFVLFGGHDGQDRNNDTWLLSAGNIWTQANLAARPPARRWHAMAYDSHRHVTVANPALAGQAFYDQIAIVAPAANALGLTLSNAVHGIIQLP